VGFTILTWYHLKRTTRHRSLILTMLVMPIIGGLVRMLLPGSHARLICAWTCPIGCALLVFGWMWVLAYMDRVSGLADGIRSTPFSSDVIAASRAAAGAALLAVQMAVFLMILALRH